MEVLERIVFESLAGSEECNLFHYGTVLDNLKRNSFEFHVGNLYGIIGEFGNGGAALSCGITGTGNINFYEGKVYIDNQESSIEYIIKNSWYVGLDLYKPKRFFKKKRSSISTQSENRLSTVSTILIKNSILKKFKVYLKFLMKELIGILNM